MEPEDYQDFSRGLDLLIKSPATQVSISYELARGNRLLDEVDSSWRSSIPDRLKQRPSYTVCMGTVVIHVPPAEQQEITSSPLISSGLFGPFGEKRAQLVDTTDHAKLRQFARFHEAYGTPRDFRSTYFFQYCYRNQRGYEFRREWVKYRWEQARINNVVIDDHEHVWVRDPMLGVINQIHPWVEGVLSAMPELRLAYMVRLCTGNCVEVEASAKELKEPEYSTGEESPEEDTEDSE